MKLTQDHDWEPTLLQEVHSRNTYSF